MNAIELNAVRKEIASLQSPCQFSVEELKVEVLKSEDDFKNGRYVTMEYMRAKHPRS
jgi:hypothetical protein